MWLALMRSPQAPPKTDLLAMYWRRHQRILRLQRDHHDELSPSGRRFMERVAVVTFSDWCDVRREGAQ